MPTRTQNRYETWANEISHYVQAHLDQPIRLEQLAAQTGISKFHLNRLFHATTGFQLGEFIQRRRLQKAFALLSQGAVSVTDVSLAVGYESHSAFSRTFLKAFGCNPAEVLRGSHPHWQTPNTLKRAAVREQELSPELVDLPRREFCGLYGKGFHDNSFANVGTALFEEISQRCLQHGYADYFSSAIGVALDSPWQNDHTESQFFAGIAANHSTQAMGLATYRWREGRWARFYYQGAYQLMWQQISRIYAGWVIPENIQLADEAIVQVYLNSPSTTAPAELMTEIYFPLQTPSAPQQDETLDSH